MSFGNNILFLRKNNNLTQEDLAEKLEVSRQTVSKWESDASFPEMDKLLTICDLFSCDMNSLIRGDVEKEAALDTCNYDAHMNNFTKSIAGATFIVLLGVAIFLMLRGLGVASAIVTMVFLSFVTFAVMIYIIAGITHDNFQKKNPVIQPFYTKEQLDRFDRRFPVLIAVPTVMILIGVIWVVGINVIPTPAGMVLDNWKTLCMAPFLLIIAIATYVYIYAGMQKSKYDIEAYNKEAMLEDAITDKVEEVLKAESLIGKCCGVIMMVATLVYLILGFLYGAWGKAWIVFVVGGMLCGIVSIILSKEK